MKREYSYLLSCITIIALIIGVAFSKDAFTFKKESLDSKQNTYEKANDKIIDDDNILAATVKVPLTITNKQNDNVENEYTYHITVNEVSGAVEAKVNNKTEYIVFDAKGAADFKLKSNSSITFLELPMDVQFKVKQEENSNYNTIINNNKTNEYSSTLTTDNKVVFENINPEIENNPQTVDKIFYVFMTLLIVSILIITLRNIKFKKYNV